MKIKIAIGLFLIGFFVFATSHNYDNLKSFLIKNNFIVANSSNENKPLSNKNHLVEKITKTFVSDLVEGKIGVFSASDYDQAFDNMFHIKIAKLPESNETAYLEYDLLGYKSSSAVARSINNLPSIGGNFTTTNNNWGHQIELLSPKSIYKGDNTILFTASSLLDKGYKIKNLKIVYRPSLIISPYSLYQFQNKLYIKGVNIDSNIKKLSIGGILVDVLQPEFEIILDSNLTNSSVSIEKQNISGQIIKEQLLLNQFQKVTDYTNLEPAIAPFYKSISAKLGSVVSYKNVVAQFPVGASKNDLAISIRGLRKKDIAALNPSMVNVTGQDSGYRLLPHGTIFEKAVTLTLPYNTKSIPEGYTPKDINIFYFDESKRLWQEVTKDSLDLKKGLITAKTNHFTDFIAGIIKMPESPETSGYTPTSIKDLKAASPLVGIQSIAPPSANNQGTANTSFNFEIPKGRGGMQPALGLQYNSDGSHSWAGMGWDLSAPSISLDTRWGAPRYDAGLETETYSMAGEMLLPNSHRENWVARSADKQFYPRREGAFQKIIRKGNSPSNYYWIVKDKSGVASYYGGTTTGLETNGVLQDATGNIGHWALCLQIDLKGNTVSYEYDKKEGELYLKKVYYTGFGSEKGNYSVTFIKDSDLGEILRPDVQVSARLGFKQNCNVLLRKIEVRFKDQMIRSYQLNYTLGAFKKTLLKEIAQYDSQSNLFYTNKMDYYDDVRDSSGKYNPFGVEQQWTVSDNKLTSPIPLISTLLPVGFNGFQPLVSSSSGSSTGINYRVGIGLCGVGAFRQNTVGGHGGNSWGDSKTSVLLEDLDGDGLPDKVFERDGTVYYCKNSSNLGENKFADEQPVSGIDNIGYTKSSSFNFGVDLALGYGKAALTVGYDKQSGTSKTKSYFMDFNGDGLVDFTNGGKVYYNRLEKGLPTFKVTSGGTPSPVSGDGNLSLTATSSITLEEILKKNPLHDIVRMWEAPASGIISVSHLYNLIKDNSVERTKYLDNLGIEKADGVHLYFQKNSQLLWDETIIATDYNEKTKLDNDITVNKGDKLFFRVSSIKDGRYDEVIWNPTITYSKVAQYINDRGNIVSSQVDINATDVDVNLYPLKEYQATTDFLSSSLGIVAVPTAGNIQFSGILKKPVTSDHFTMRIIKKLAPPSTSESVIFTREFGANEVINFDMASIPVQNAEELSQLRIELITDTNINWHSISFEPSVILPKDLRTDPLLPRETKKMEVSHTFYRKREGNYLIPGEVCPFVASQKLSIFIDPNDFQLITPTFFNLDQINGEILITAKQNNKIVGRKRYQLTNGTLSENSNILDINYNYDKVVTGVPIQLELLSTNPKTLPYIRNYPRNNALNIQLQVKYLDTDSNGNEITKDWNQSVDNYAIYTPLELKEEGQLGLLYRNWGGFVINGTQATSVIDINNLKASQKYQDSENNQPDVENPNINLDGYSSTSDEYFNTINPLYSDTTWYGLEKGIYIRNKYMGASRLGEDDIAEYSDFAVPTNSIGGSTTALEMINESKSRSLSAGVSYSGGVGGGGIGGSTSDGNTVVVQTMSDFNGDRFPDYIRNENVQFTTPRGGISDKIVNIGEFSNSETHSQGANGSGSYNHGKPSTSLQLTIGKQTVQVKSAAQDAASASEKGGNSASLSASVGNGDDESANIHSDINGDGLSDKISNDGTILLNSGYGFLPQAENWNFQNINKGTSKDWSAGLGYSIMSGSFSGGLNYARSTSDSEESLIDINADGLADKIRYTDSEMFVRLNLGDHFDATEIIYPRYEAMNRNSSISYGASAGATYDFCLFFIRLSLSFGGSYGKSISRSEATLMDINGDGYLDYIQSKDEDNLVVRLSTIGKTNKLKSVTNAPGNSFIVEYQQLPTSYEDPSARWVLTKVDINDGHTGDGIDHSIAQFKYENGHHDRREREFYGFGKVTQQQLDASDNSVFSTSVQEFYNQDHFRKNLLKRSYSLDKNGKMRQESKNEYSFVDVTTQGNISESLLNDPVCDSKRIFIAMIHSNEKMYEGGSEYLEKNTFNKYDANGNIVQYEDLGNGSSQDKVTAKITYHESDAPYYGGIPKLLEVTTIDGLRRKRATQINATTAEITQIQNYIATDKVAVTDIGYDTYGNLLKITGATNYKGQRMTLDYVYDNDTHSYITEIKDAFGYQNKMQYDYRFGAVLKTTDRNDQSTNYTIDAIGRTKTIQGPYEIASGKPYTIAYEYYPTAVVPYAKTRNYDPELDKDIETYTYTDGLGRALQVKKTASLFTSSGSPDQEALIVSGKIIYDGLGRPTTSYYPTTTTSIDANFSTALSSVTPTLTEYDIVGRAVKVTLPDNSTNKTSYKLDSFNSIPSMLTTQTDALGNIVKSHTDVTGKNLASIQNNLVTQFKINALGETVQVTDALAHITSSSYDWLGRRTEFSHPDAGTTKMEYDLSSNLVARITQDIKNTVPNGGAIKYLYDYNRLEEIQYPKNPQNNVRYNYGKASGTPARRGRVWFLQDATGGQEFFYGKLGEVEKEIRTLRITSTDIQTYISQFEYDTWNRIQKMTYPDGEIVDYRYNRAGNLLSMQGIKENHTYDYIKQLAYDEFEQRKYLKYGNDTQTNYTYDPVMRRLQQLLVSNSTREVMNNKYKYDVVGNVLGIKNSAPVIANTLGGTSNHEYQYDEFYRLKNAKATYTGEFTEANYELNMSYNNMHNITKKELVHSVNNIQKGYTLNYDYGNETHPNAPNIIAEVGKQQPRQYLYDGNGNPTSYSEFQSFRKMTWDEENRLMGINDNGRIFQYSYDSKGDRVIKSSGDSQNVSINGQTAATIVHSDDYIGYVSPYFVISKGKFTKHYFEGAGRIVSKLGNGTFAQPLKITAGGINYTQLSAAQQAAIDQYTQTLGLPPGPPTQQGIYASPAFTGSPYPSPTPQEVKENQEPPNGWPRYPTFNAPGDVPGPPVQYGAPVTSQTVQSGSGFTGSGLPENDIFYFHPDHLGSTSYITTKDGNISQHVEYIAFGEVMFEEHASSFSSPYLFNGKELDRETNLSFYGARYLDMKTSLWLSVDPLAEKYAGVGSYTYCLNNPIIHTDATGRSVDGEFEITLDKKGKEVKTKISNLGDNTNTDFNHYVGGEKNGKTEIVNTSTGDKTMMKSSAFMRGFTHREASVKWFNIFEEFKNGTGPEKSLITGSDNTMVQDIMKSPQFAYAAKAFLENGTDKNLRFAGEFGISGIGEAGGNMTAQMIGKANISFYPVGDQLTIMAVDTKSFSSWSLNPIVKFISNWSDYYDTSRQSGKIIPESTTFQTYIWTLPIKK